MINYSHQYLNRIFIVLLLIIISIIIHINKKIKIGIFGCRHDINIGNFLIKYAMYVKLEELGYEPYIVTTNQFNVNISFLNSTTNLVNVKDYSDIKENDYDILLVNSDQTWRRWDIYFYDCGFLNFAKNWNKLKFVYGASLGYDYWNFNKEEENIIKPLISYFSEISVREAGSIPLIEKHFGISPKLVLDPTLIINKNYYLNLIKDYNINSNYRPNNYIFVYHIYNIKSEVKSLIEKAQKELNCKVYYYNLNYNSLVEEFIFYIKNSKAVITNSLHCTIFSVLFERPFISFNHNETGIERLKSFSELLGFEERIVYTNQTPNITLLSIPLKINKSTLSQKKEESINYIKNNLKLYKKSFF